jgi:hypothetical protein
VPLHRAPWDVPIEDFYRVLRYTRHWIHYGTLAHIGMCVVIAAVKGMLGD